MCRRCRCLYRFGRLGVCKGVSVIGAGAGASVGVGVSFGVVSAPASVSVPDICSGISNVSVKLLHEQNIAFHIMMTACRY